jgi:1,4-alpha-glucan branching enzyme
MSYKIFEYDPALKYFENDIEQRMKNFEWKKGELLKGVNSLKDFANGHEYFGFHKVNSGWYYREWAPSADAVYLTGDFNNWATTALKLNKLENGVFEIFIEGEKTLYDGCHVQTIVEHNGELLRRVPLYARRVEQEKNSPAFCAVIVDQKPYHWKHKNFTPDKNVIVY